MTRTSGFVRLAAVAGLLVIPFFTASPQTVRRSPLIIQAVDESQLITLPGNTRREATAENDRGQVADDFELDHLLLQLKRSPEQETDLQRFLNDVQDPGSSSYHQWLTPDQFGERFGASDQDLGILRRWLGSHGFTVNRSIRTAC